MGKRNGYIPANKVEFDEFFKNIVQYSAQKASGANPEWSHIPKEDRDAIVAAYGAWFTAYSLTLTAHTFVETREKDRVREAVEKQMKEFVNHFLRHKPVTDSDRDSMGIPNRPAARTPVKKPDELVELTLEQKGPGRVLVCFKAKGSDSRGKPRGYKGALMKWAVSDKVVARTAELGESGYATKTPFLIELDEDQRGKTISVASRWENRKTEKGPWSPIQWTIVP